MNANKSPLIFAIKRGSIDDGAGIRTVVFLKGCPLCCRWCHNPESMAEGREYFYDASRCIGCGNCAGDCPAGAFVPVGRYYDNRELMEILLEDRIYYSLSGGGVTFSGGEPLMHMKYVGDIAKRLINEKIPVTVETGGYFDYEMFSIFVLPYISCVLYDIKIFDRNKHIKYTGTDNDIIFKNLKRLVNRIKIIPRTPLIPGITDTRDNLENISRFLGELGLRGHVTLPYNAAGERKRKLLLEGNERTKKYK